MQLESQLSRMNCQTFSVGLSSGHFSGSGRMVVLVGALSFFDMCQPAYPSGEYRGVRQAASHVAVPGGRQFHGSKSSRLVTGC
jgi:hypothetical protein